MIHKAPVTGLHGSKLLPFLQHSTKHLMLALSWMVGVNGCSFGLPHPAACTLVVCLKHSTKHLMLALSWMVGVNGCSFGLPHLAACTLAVPLSDLWTCPQTPLFT